MVLALIGGLIGTAVSSIVAQRQQSAQMAQAQAYNSQLNRESFDYSTKLNKQQYDYTTKLNNQMEGINQALMDYQYRLERNSRQSSYQDTRLDLQNAGYNPLLAVGQQSNSLGVGSSMSSSGFSSANFNSANSLSDVSSSYLNALSGINDTKRTTSAIAQGRSQIDLNKSQIQSSTYLNALNRARTELVHSQTSGQDINNNLQALYGAKRSMAEIEKIGTEANLNRQLINESKKKVALMATQGTVNSALAQSYQNQNILNKAYVDFSKNHPIYSGTVTGINRLFGNLSLPGVFIGKTFK